MIHEKHLIYTDKGTYTDREENILHDCVIFSSVLNYNGGIYTENNLDELVEIGNSKTGIYSYIGHAKTDDFYEIKTDDRLADRIGEWIKGSFRKDGNVVRASLKLFEVNEVNPKLEKNFNEFVLKLSETMPDKCGFSVVIWTRSNDEEIIIKDIACIDLVEFPATTIAMFSKNEVIMDEKEEKELEKEEIKVEKSEYEEKILKLEELFGSLISALKSGENFVGIKMELLKEIESLGFEETKEPEEIEDKVEIEIEKTEESVEKKEEISIADLITRIDALTKIVEALKPELESKEMLDKNSKKEEKFVVREFSVVSPIEDSEPEINHMNVYNEMISERKYSEAAVYYNKNIKR